MHETMQETNGVVLVQGSSCTPIQAPTRRAIYLHRFHFYIALAEAIHHWRLFCVLQPLQNTIAKW